ncbi:MAG: hypothetical protein ABSA52_21740 [Candidatus Binatia bacterium]|jgi:hypothetical protein
MSNQYIQDSSIGEIRQAPNTDPIPGQIYGRRSGAGINDNLPTCCGLVTLNGPDGLITTFSVDAREMVASGSYEYV